MSLGSPKIFPQGNVKDLEQDLSCKYREENLTTLFEPAQSKCTWTSHKRHSMRELPETCHTPRTGPMFCASLRSRNAHGHRTRAILCRKEDRVPWSSPRLNFCCKNPSVWTHCLGNSKTKCPEQKFTIWM